jgi:hypothetical protein
LGSLGPSNRQVCEQYAGLAKRENQCPVAHRAYCLTMLAKRGVDAALARLGDAFLQGHAL